jgi:hypothetical protein
MMDLTSSTSNHIYIYALICNRFDLKPEKRKEKVAKWEIQKRNS